MSGDDPGIESVIEKVLFTKDWGIPKGALSTEEASTKGMALVGNRWVDRSEELSVRRVSKAVGRIRASERWMVVVFFLYLLLLLVIVTPFFMSYGGPPGPVYFCLFTGLASLMFVHWYAMCNARPSRNQFRRRGYQLLKSFNIMALAVLTAVFAALLSLGWKAWGIDIFLWLIVLTPAVCGVLFLTGPTVNKIIEIGEKRALAAGDTKTSWLTFGKIAALGLLMCGNVALGLHYAHWYETRPIRSCDRAASADIGKLASSLERLGNELVALECGSGDNPFQKGMKLEYLRGPYYGWRGTTHKCQVLIRLVGNEIQGCSLRGTRPQGQGSRYLYRARVAGGADLPATIGRCEGKSYAASAPDDRCYTSSAVGLDCTLGEPKEWKRCGDVAEQ